jgi:hypothetical protein
MKIKDINESVAGPEKCWPGHRKVGTQPGTGKNAGKRVNDCEKIKEDDVAEGGAGSGRTDSSAWDTTPGKVGRVEKTATGIRHHADPSRYGGTEPSTEINKLDKTTTSATDKALGVKWDRESKRYYSPIKVDEQGNNPEYDDEAGMADNNLETLERAVAGIDDLIQAGDNLPEWCQEKIAVAKSMLVAVWDYMESEEDSEEVDPEIDEMFEVMDLLAEELAAKHKVDVDTVWESFEALDDHMLYETAAWRRKEGKSKSGGLNAKGVASYRRENPGSKLQTAVTTKPSKLKPGSKAAKRRKSFCARMSGVKGPMKKPNGKPTRKALALRKWNC